MRNSDDSRTIVSGVGITSAIGQGKAAFISALLEGEHNFDVMKRPGRQVSPNPGGVQGEPVEGTAFLGAEISEFSVPESASGHTLRTASLSGQVAVATLHEAWTEAKLGEMDPARIGLVIGGSNFQQRELTRVHDAYRGRVHFLRPSYGMSFLDSDLCGLCTEWFGIRGFAYTLGGASASGQMAVLQAIEAVRAGHVDACIAIGALMDLSYWELQSFKTLGAMGSTRYASEPARACRPFDRDRDGFIYGESCGAIVVERSSSAATRGVPPYASFTGWAVGLDANRNPDPSFKGEARVIQAALKDSKCLAEEIDYVNPHGTGSVVGDEVELRAICHCGLGDAFINATKSITGHGLSAAGTIEIIATLLQMERGQLHPTRNLAHPIEPSCKWVQDRAVPHAIEHALSLSMGFGGVSSAVCLQRC